MSKESRPSSHENNNLLRQATDTVESLFVKEETFKFVKIGGDKQRAHEWFVAGKNIQNSVLIYQN